jgi:hypothetical protein
MVFCEGAISQMLSADFPFIFILAQRNSPCTLGSSHDLKPFYGTLLRKKVQFYPHSFFSHVEGFTRPKRECKLIFS